MSKDENFCWLLLDSNWCSQVGMCATHNKSFVSTSEYRICFTGFISSWSWLVWYQSLCTALQAVPVEVGIMEYYLTSRELQVAVGWPTMEILLLKRGWPFSGPVANLLKQSPMSCLPQREHKSPFTLDTCVSSNVEEKQLSLSALPLYS